MSRLSDLISKIENPELRAQIEEAANQALKQKKFGLVFEEHLPECTPLYDIPVGKGKRVSLKNGKVSETYMVLKIDGDKAICMPKDGEEAVEIPVADLVVTAEFGEPIYPCLKPLGEVCNAPDSDLWHTLIEADNYHALQLLEYLYSGKVDCIYIDPPYNKVNSRDWKYNCNYVDGNDSYRHSKWLSMVQKRLLIAKKLLNPENSTLIITIDEEEYLHLGCLLEEMFPEAQIQMVSISINPSGAIRKDLFSRADEYAFYVMLGNAHIIQPKGEDEEVEVRWWYLRRLEYGSRRGTVKGGTAQFYPIYIDPDTNKIVKIGDALPHNQDRNTAPQIDGTVTVFPIRDDGLEMNWGVTGATLQRLLDQKVIQVYPNKDSVYQPYTIKYLSENFTDKINSGRWAVRGYRDDGSKIVVETGGKITRATTVWRGARYDAKTYGTVLLKGIIGDARFSFPKSLYSVLDSLRYVVADKPDALIVDFFAGSGTTLHAVNLLNAEDGGQRRCIMVTNNEVSAEEATTLTSQGYSPGDLEWEKFGIARYVTWPRTVCSIKGQNILGKPLVGDYGITEEEYVLDEESAVVSKSTGKPVKKNIYIKKKVKKTPALAEIKKADGFKTNAIFFKLGFLDKTKVSLGMQFKELLSTLWMKAGAIGKCPVIDASVSDMLILPENKMAILTDENHFGVFAEQLAQHPEIEVVYLVTDYESSYVAMTQALEGKKTYQLYRDYLDNFRINAGRNSR